MARILVVDDRAPNRDFLLALLGHFGHEVREASDGLQALDVMDGWRPDLVISDIVMPELDGVELARRMAALPVLAAVPVIFYTASYRVREARELASGVGVRRVLPKPSEPQAILDAVYEALGEPMPAIAAHGETAVEASSKRESLLARELRGAEELNRNLEALLDRAMELARQQRRAMGGISGLERQIESVQEVGLRLASLVEIGLDLAEERSPAALLDIFCRGAQDMLSTRYAGVAIVDGKGALERFVARGLGTSAARVGAELHACPVVSRAIRERRVERLEGAALDAAAVGSSHPPAGSFLVAPISSMGRTVGWLYGAARLGKDAFTDDDARIATTVASQIGAAWTNLSLFEELTVRARQLEEEKEAREAATTALEESRGRLAGLVASAMDAIVSVDHEQRIVLFNPAAEKMFGYPAAEVAGKPLDLLIPEGQRAEHRAQVTGYRDHGTTSRRMGRLLTVRGLRRNGEEFPLEASISLHPGAGGSVATAILRDVSEALRAREELQESELRFRQLAENIRKVFYLVEPATGKVVYVSPAYRDVFGRGPDALYDDPASFIEGVVPEDRERVVALHTPRPRVEPFDVEYRIELPGGARRIVRDRAWPVSDGAGNTVRVAGVIEDVTERRAAEELVRNHARDLERAVAERTSELAAANKELEAFDYSVSHDLRAPVRRVLGFAEALAKEAGAVLSPAAGDHLRRIASAAREMEQLIDDLFSLSTLTRAEFHRGDVDLGRLAEDVVGQLRRENPWRKVEVAVAQGLRTRADPGLLRVLLENLVGNAWKFTSGAEEPWIEIGSELRDGEPAFFVRDNGAGFDMGNAGRLFTPFQRLHDKATFEGTGIGLATVKRIVLRHGGRVWASAAPGRGATFFFTLEPHREAA